MIQALFGGEKNVTELVEATGGTQANVSRHLQTLTAAHVLARRKGEDPDRPLTPEEAAQAAAGRDLARRARQNAKLMRKAGKLPKF